MPKDERERQILDKLTVVRDSLLLLKRDRTRYIRTQDVMLLYDQLVGQVKELNEVRKGERKGENRCMWRTDSANANAILYRHHSVLTPSRQWTRFSRAAFSSFRSSS